MSKYPRYRYALSGSDADGVMCLVDYEPAPGEIVPYAYVFGPKRSDRDLKIWAHEAALTAAVLGKHLDVPNSISVRSDLPDSILPEWGPAESMGFLYPAVSTYAVIISILEVKPTVDEVIKVLRSVATLKSAPPLPPKITPYRWANQTIISE